jgi:uncharacterized protein YciI
MYWAVWCRDSGVSPEVRKTHGKTHSAYLDKPPLPLVMAGPWLADEVDGTGGSFMIYRAETRAEVEAAVANDPFAQHGIWASTEIRPFKMARSTLSLLTSP